MRAKIRRLCAVWNEPSSPGRSRQGEQVWYFHAITSKVRRWSAHRRPRTGSAGITPEAAIWTLRQAVQVLTTLLGPERNGALGRGELAAMATGSAHGLDDGTWLARLRGGRDLRPAPRVHVRQRRHGGLHLLDALAATGCRFAYHGDFDWPGIALANRVIRRYEALPWRMGTADYERLAAHSQAEGIPQLPLDGPSSRTGTRISPLP